MKNWKTNALRHILFYTIDMSFAILGFVYGFGLTVKSWPMLIGMLILARFSTHILHGAFWLSQSKEQTK